MYTSPRSTRPLEGPHSTQIVSLPKTRTSESKSGFSSFEQLTNSLLDRIWSGLIICFLNLIPLSSSRPAMVIASRLVRQQFFSHHHVDSMLQHSTQKLCDACLFCFCSARCVLRFVTFSSSDLVRCAGCHSFFLFWGPGCR